MFELEVVLLGQKLQDRGKDFLQHLFHALGTKAVDRAEVRSLAPCDPHEHDIFADLAICREE